VGNNARAVINRFLGFYDGNPVNLHPLSPQDSAPLYVEMMGGSAKIMAKGRQLIAKGQYLQATEILNKLVFAQPQNQAARRLLANAYEQLGYQAESTSVRNSFLQGSYELRNGLPSGTGPRSTGPDDQLRGLMVSFTPNFEILPGTAPKAPAKGLVPFVMPDQLDSD
jgi:alkyl sulfatase BDS1-like metallo-beta-lactamase superfamily hydrolase